VQKKYCNTIMNNPNYVNLYLWVSHGENISSINNYYPVPTQFKSLAFYSRPYDEITSELLRTFDVDICRVLLSSCPLIPITDNEKKTKKVYLPPLIFASFKNDPVDIKELTGLYHLVIEKTGTDITGKDICKYIKNEKILTHEAIISLFGNGQIITYSIIFDLVTKDCNKKGINPEDVILGIYSCQSKSMKYSSQTNAPGLVARITEDNSITPATIYDNLTKPDASLNINLTLIPFTTLKIWEPLAGVKYQGCALNVLSYYDIIETSKAREEAVCLNLNDTTIYKIVDYIDNYFKRKYSESNSGYIIVKLPFISGISLLLDYINDLEISNYSIIFKLYTTGQIEHTASFAKTTDAKTFDQLYYIDPQSELQLPILINSTPEQITQSIIYLYNLTFESIGIESIGIIFTVSQNSYQKMPNFKFPYFTKSIYEKGGEILKRPISGGAKKKKGKGKNKSKGRRNKKNKTKKNKTNGKEKEKEKEKDPYIQLVNEIDEKYGVPSVLVE
jgi:hypothetical protein